MRTTRILAVAAAGVLVTGLGGVGAAVAGDGLNVSGTDLAPNAIGYSKNIELLSNTPAAGLFAEPGSFGTDIGFKGDLAFVGNYNGFTIYDISTPSSPTTVSQVVCPGSQNDVTISGDLLYLSTDSSRTDDSCASTSQTAANPESWEGIKIFDVSDPADPQYVAAVETDCGSHTNTLVPGDGVDYIYVSSYSPNAAFPDCQPPHDAISIVQVPTADPASASLVEKRVIFPDGGNPGANGSATTSGCHDITAYPSKGIAAGACMGDGVIFDISDPEAPVVIETVRDTENFAFWHSATFNNKGTKVVFTDELGGGGRATCNDATGPTRGANAIYELSSSNELTFASYYKIPRNQADSENCVAHNGSIVPLPGRDVMVQSWYQGGVSVWDFTDSENPRELDYFERGPLSKPGFPSIGGTWSAYYYNGHVYSSDIVEGFDVLKLKDPSLKKAADVTLDQLNPQSQPVYPTKGKAKK